VDKDFLEEERFEAVEAMAAIIKLKEHVQLSAERERQISAELKEAHIQLQRSSSSNERNAKELVKEREREYVLLVTISSSHCSFWLSSATRMAQNLSLAVYTGGIATIAKSKFTAARTD
jgi:hypothetical protein